MAVLEDVTITVVTPLINLWNGIVEIFPGLVGGLVIAILGYLIALALGHGLRLLLEKAGLDTAVQKLKLPKTVGKLKLSNAFGTLTKWYIFIVFLQAAVDAMNLGTISILLTQLALWLPQLIIAVLAVLAGLFIAHYLANLLEEHSDMKGVRVASSFFKVLIVFIAVVIALEQVGLEVSILENAFLILLASLGLGFALAVGLSFGLGAKEEAKEWLARIRKNF